MVKVSESRANPKIRVLSAARTGFVTPTQSNDG